MHNHVSTSTQKQNHTQMHVYSCIHTNTGMVHVNTCIWVCISTKRCVRNTTVGNRLLATIHCRMLHLLNHIANLLTPSTNFVVRTILKPSLSKQGSIVRRGLYPRKLKVFLLVKNTYKWKLSHCLAHVLSIVKHLIAKQLTTASRCRPVPLTVGHAGTSVVSLQVVPLVSGVGHCGSIQCTRDTYVCQVAGKATDSPVT